MLFKNIHLQGIRSGEITLAFRKWNKAKVKTGSLLNTAVGVIQIHTIQEIKEIDITEKDAICSGFSEKAALLASFPSQNSGTIFRIELAYYSEDPRIKLRENILLTEPQYMLLLQKLRHLDQYSKYGNWTETILSAIRDNPHLHAVKIGQLTGFEKEWLKLNIRKLKNLGLTISHSVGYELSPLGEIFMERYLETK